MSSNIINTKSNIKDRKNINYYKQTKIIRNYADFIGIKNKLTTITIAVAAAATATTTKPTEKRTSNSTTALKEFKFFKYSLKNIKTFLYHLRHRKAFRRKSIINYEEINFNIYNIYNNFNYNDNFNLKLLFFCSICYDDYGGGFKGNNEPNNKILLKSIPIQTINSMSTIKYCTYIANATFNIIEFLINFIDFLSITIFNLFYDMQNFCIANFIMIFNNLNKFSSMKAAMSQSPQFIAISS